jgi:hypothetical protein
MRLDAGGDELPVPADGLAGERAAGSEVGSGLLLVERRERFQSVESSGSIEGPGPGPFVGFPPPLTNRV